MVLCNNLFKNIFTYTKSRQIKKCSRFAKVSKPSSPSLTSHTVSTDRWVVNLMNEDITEQECSLLKKGLNFAITPDRINFDNFITPIESSPQHLSPDVADPIRSLICHILKNATIPHCNFAPVEKKSKETAYFSSSR